MNAAIAGLIGTALGVLGTLGGQALSPVLTARHARRAKADDLKRQSYEAGFVALSQIGMAMVAERHTAEEAFFRLASVSGQIEFAGAPHVAAKFRTAASLVARIRTDNLDEKSPGWQEKIRNNHELLDAFDDWFNAARDDLKAK